MKRNPIRKHTKKAAAFAVCTAMLMTSLGGCGTVATSNFEDPLNKDEVAYEFAEYETYKNHLEIEGQWGKGIYTGDGEYGIGDPFVMRFDGKYYMYPSSSIVESGEKGIKVFESEDLINWTYKGVAIEGKEVEAAYAPEVVYYNGSFYMTEAPNGKGHYIFKSDSPIGPFTRVTENFGRNIDGSFWVADDGKLFFLYPGNNVIQVAEIDTETMLPGVETDLVGTLNGWTEGPSYFRRGDILYLTYAGNGVTSDGYRVGYSYQLGNDPAGQFVMPNNNIILLKTGPENFKGLGHSSNVVGPNLDSWYTAYHNLIGVAGPQRRMMVDQLVTNGGMLLANGPTYSEVAMPERPDFETRGLDEMTKANANGKEAYVSKESAKATLTAEYNFTPEKDTAIEFLFGWSNDKNYFSVRLDMAAGTLSLLEVKKGTETVVETAEIAALALNKLHTVRIEAGADKTYVYLDTMRKLSSETKGVEGNIGVSGEAAFSYMAYTNDVFGTSDFESVKNLPSSFPAVHYLKEENRGFSIKNAKVTEDGIRQGEAENTRKSETDGSYALVLDTANDWVKYVVNATEDSYYGLSASITPESAGAQFQVIVDSKEIYTFTVPKAGEVSEAYVNLMLGQFPLEEGNHTLKIRLVSGTLDVNRFDMAPTNPTELNYENPMDELNEKGWSYLGNWKIVNGAHEAKPGDTAYAYAGTEELTDFTIDVEIALTEEASMYDGGIMLRAKNHSISAAQVSESLQGYYLAIRNDQITLNRYNYGVETLDLIDVDFKQNEFHKIRVVAENNHIQVFVDDMETPAMDCYDSAAWLSGQIILCANKAGIAFKGVKIRS